MQNRWAVLALLSRITFDVGTAMLVVCFALYGLYRRLQARHASAAIAVGA